MNTDFGAVEQWIGARIPGAVVKEHQECGPSVAYLFESPLLRGVYVSGEEADAETFDLAVRKWTQERGPISIILEPKRFHALVYRPSDMESPSLSGKVITPQPVQPESPFAHKAADNLFRAHAAQAYYLHAFAYAQELNQAKVAETNQLLQANIDKCTQLTSQLRGTALPTDIKWGPTKIRGWDGKFHDGKQTYGGRRHWVKPKLEPIATSGNIDDLYKLFPQLQGWVEVGRDWGWRDQHIAGTHGQGSWPQKYYVDQETGIVYSDEDRTYIESFAKALWERERLKGVLTKVEHSKQLLGLQMQHMPWERTLAGLEDLAICLENRQAYEIVRSARAGNNLIEGIRMMSLFVQQFRQLPRTDGVLDNALWIGKSIFSVMHPALACVQMYCAVLAMAKSVEDETRRPLSQKEFFDVINQCVMPLIEDVHKSLQKGQRRLREAMDANTQTLVSNLEFVHSQLTQLVKRQGSALDARLDRKDFHDFVVGAQARLTKYYNQLSDAADYIEGRRVPEANWFHTYCKNTRNALENAQTAPHNGFNGDRAVYSIREVPLNPVYSSGIVYSRIRNRNTFLTELSVLYTASHTYIQLVQAVMTQESFHKSDKIDGLIEVGARILEGIKQQLALFDQIEPAFNKLLRSHMNFMQDLRNNKAAVSETKQQKVHAAHAWVIAYGQQAERNGFAVGHKMFAYNDFVHSPMKLKSYSKEIAQEIRSGENWETLYFPLFVFSPDQWREVASAVDEYVTHKDRTLFQLIQPRVMFSDKSIVNKYEGGTLKRRIWWDGKNFQSKVSVTRISKNPLPFYPNADVDLECGNAVPPKRPLLDCTVTYYVDRTLKTEFASESKLQREDVEAIARVPATLGTKHQDRMNDLFWLVSGAGDRCPAMKQYVDHFEVCTSLQAEMPPLPLPSVFMDRMRRFFCPQVDRLALTGTIVDMKYSFVKEEEVYKLKVHAVYEGLSYVAQTVAEFDPSQVECFRESSDKAVNFTEFLCNVAFQTYDGIPGVDSYFNEDKKIVAPVLEPFAGLWATLEKAQVGEKYCYCEGGSAIRKTGFEPNPDLYLRVQDLIREKCTNIEKMARYREFKRNYKAFMALASLVSSAGNMQSKLASLGVFRATDAGWLEHAYFYSPASEVRQRDVLTDIKDLAPSLAKNSLVIHAEQIAHILGFLQTNAEQPSIEAVMRLLQARFVNTLGVDNSKPRARLEEEILHMQDAAAAKAGASASASVNANANANAKREPARPAGVRQSQCEVVARKMGAEMVVEDYIRRRQWEPVLLLGLDKLKTLYSVRIIAGDGHCLFRALAAGMLYHAKRGGQIPERFREFVNKRPTVEEVIERHSDSMVRLLRQWVSFLIEVKDEKLDTARASAISRCDTIEEYKRQITAMGPIVLEGEDAELTMLANVLGLNVHILDIEALGKGEKMDAPHKFRGPAQGNDISLLFRPGHYDLLIPMPK